MLLGEAGKVRTGLRDAGEGRPLTEPLTEPKPLDNGLCCHDSVPLRDKVDGPVAGNDGLGGCSGDGGCGS